MFYVRNYMSGKYGVADTNDGVLEYYTKEQLLEISKKIKIRGVETDRNKVNLYDIVTYMNNALERGAFAGVMFVNSEVHMNNDNLLELNIYEPDDGILHSEPLDCLVIPKGIEVIGNSMALDENGGIKSIRLPESLRKFSEYGSIGSRKYTSGTIIKIPSGVEDFGENTLNFCSGVSKVILPPKIEQLGYASFCACLDLQEVVFTGSSLKYIGDDCFGNCNQLKHIKYHQG